MTTLEKLSRAERWRVKTGQFASSRADGWNGLFIVPLDGSFWHVAISDSSGWRHLSVSNAQQRRKLPSWEIMCRLREAFFGDDEWVVQYHPPKYQDSDDPFTLHLWAPLDAELPKPDFYDLPL